MSHRSIIPTAKELSIQSIPRFDKQSLSNGTEVHRMPDKKYTVCNIEWLFFAGRPKERKEMASRFTAAMLKGGTTHHSSEQIDKWLDKYGASLSVKQSMDFITLSLSCQKKHLNDLLPLVVEILESCDFPQEELDHVRRNQEQKLASHLLRTDSVSYRAISEHVYGKNHYYGYNSSAELIQAIDREDIHQHYELNIRHRPMHIFCAGAPIDLKVLDHFFGQWKVSKSDINSQLSARPRHEVAHENYPIPGAQQSSLKMAKLWVSKKHEDYIGLSVLNTIFGGYYGSRLMRTLREERGMTYQVYSISQSHRHASCHIIGAELNSDALIDATESIKEEMIKMQKILIPTSELNTVKSYLMGSFYSSLDGVFELIKLAKNCVVHNLSPSYYVMWQEKIKGITAEELRQLAQQYLVPEDYSSVSAGPIKERKLS